jgi:hypothetical protein
MAMARMTWSTTRIRFCEVHRHDPISGAVLRRDEADVAVPFLSSILFL